MRAKVRLTLLIVTSVLTGIAVWVSHVNRTERKRRMSETREAVRKTVEFLKPDMTNDLRFGRKASSTPTPTPVVP